MFFKSLANMVQSITLSMIGGLCTVVLTVSGTYGVCRAYNTVCNKLNQPNVITGICRTYNSVREKISQIDIDISIERV